MRLAPKLVICGLLPGLVLAGVQLASGSSAAAEQPALWIPAEASSLKAPLLSRWTIATQSCRTAGVLVRDGRIAAVWRGQNHPRVSKSATRG